LPVVLNYSETDAIAALRGLLLTIVPGLEVISAQDNRVPEPAGADFVVMTVIQRVRLSTNVDFVQDTVFAGSIAGTVLTYVSPSRGDLRVGTLIYGIPAIANPTAIVSIDTATSATVSPAQTAPFGPLYAGYKTAFYPAEFHVQLDVHGPASGNNIVKLATLLRDEYATQWFDDSGIDLGSLYADEPRQVPFINAEAQWEKRWMLDVCLQANQIVQVPQQFSDKLNAGLINVDVVYPP
jgi:hypothetical protein